MSVRHSLLVVAVFLFCTPPISYAQQQPSIGVPVPPLGEGPWVFDTAEQHKISVSVVTKGLSHPWAIAFLPNGDMLVTERPGRLRIVRDGVLEPQVISGVPPVRTDGNGGLMDIALHPKFTDNRLVYLTYTKPVGNGRGAPALARGRLEAGALTDVRDLLVHRGIRRELGSQRPRCLRARWQSLHVHRRQSSDGFARSHESAR